MVVLGLIVAIVGLAAAVSAPVSHSEERDSSLRSEWIVRDPITSMPALQQRFGRDTLLYFPMDARPNLPVVAVTAPAFTR